MFQQAGTLAPRTLAGEKGNERGTKVSAGELLSEQDTIVVFGPLQNYNGTTPEVHGYICEHRPASSSTGIDKSAQSVSEMPQKFLRDGRLYIRREKVIYDVLGKSAM